MRLAEAISNCFQECSRNDEALQLQLSYTSGQALVTRGDGTKITSILPIAHERFDARDFVIQCLRWLHRIFFCLTAWLQCGIIARRPELWSTSVQQRLLDTWKALTRVLPFRLQMLVRAHWPVDLVKLAFLHCIADPLKWTQMTAAFAS